MISSYSFPLNGLRNSIWFLGIPVCLLGTSDRIIAMFADNYVSYREFSYVVTIIFILLGWIALKPKFEKNLTLIEKFFSNHAGTGTGQSSLVHNETHLLAARTRLLELQNYHVISQVYKLPFPYLSQIYHLLNLKHLETVHGVSLGRLKVVDVCSFQSTPLGGTVKFRTTLDSPFNLLKIWRQPCVDVELILHTPYMVELKIPVYGEKKMIVMFNVLPLSETSHKFAIDIYTDLQFPKFLLSAMLHLAAFITLYEDLPYLKKLSDRNLGHLLKPAKASSQEMMWLFKRFVKLYATQLQPS